MGKEEEAFKDLLRRLENESMDIQHIASEVIEKIENKRVIPFLVEKLSDGSMKDRWLAARVLGYLRIEETVEPLFEAFIVALSNKEYYTYSGLVHYCIEALYNAAISQIPSSLT